MADWKMGGVAGDLPGPLPEAYGGTGTTALRAGVVSSLTGLPLPEAQGGTGAASLSAVGVITPTSYGAASDGGVTSRMAPQPDGVERFAVPLADVSRAIMLRTVLKARRSITGLDGILPARGGGYPAFFLRDTYHGIVSFPGYFNAAWIRAMVDFWSGYVDAFGAPKQNIGYPTGTGTSGVADSPAYFALLVALAHRLGDRTALAAHSALIDAGFAALPRSAAGLITTSAGRYTYGWGFEDTVTLAGEYGMATALTGWAYRELARCAADLGDAAEASRYTAAADGFVTALRTLRRSDGFYNAAGGEAKPHVILTSLVVSAGLCSKAEAAASSSALVAQYRAGNITDSITGAVRHLVKPNYWTTTATTQGTYQNGGYWLGEWTAWLARAMSISSPEAGTQLMREATAEIVRQHRVTAGYLGYGDAGFEWQNDTSNLGSWGYCATAGFLAYVADATPDIEAKLEGATASSVAVPLMDGHRISSVEVLAPAATTAGIAITSSDRKSTARTESVTDQPFLFETAPTGVASVALSAAAGAAARSGVLPGNSTIRGGVITATVASGSAATPFSVRLLQRPIRPALAAPAWGVADAFAADSSADYTIVGTWTIGTGKLRNAVTGAAHALRTSVSASNVLIQCKVTSADWTVRNPALVVRATSSPATMAAVAVFVSAGVGFLAGYDISAGSWGSAKTQKTFPILTNGAEVTLFVQVAHGTITAWIAEVATARISWVTTVSQVGAAGAKIGPFTTGTTEVTFDDLQIGPPTQPVPPGFVLDDSSGVFGVDEAYTVTAPSSLLDSKGNTVAAGSTGNVATY